MEWDVPHLSVSPSEYARKESSTRDPVCSAPLYYHWLAMEMYKVFCSSSSSNSNFELPTESSLQRIVTRFTVLPSLSECCTQDGRGVLCKQELKDSEIAHTGFFARELDRFLFPGDTCTTKGACFHQYPVDKVSQSIPTADFYVCRYSGDFPSTPVLVGNMKLLNMDEAKRETAAYCVKVMEVYKGEKTATVILGLAMTPRKTKLFLNLTGDRILYTMEVCEIHSSHSTKKCIGAFFRMLYGAVHYLIDHRVILKAPCIEPFEHTTTRLGRRVFLDNDSGIVYKLYDNSVFENPMHTLKALTKLPEKYQNKFSHRKLNERVDCLQYEYIPGRMTPHSLCQFACILKDLSCLHAKNFVHGDIRKENLLFNEHIVTKLG